MCFKLSPEKKCPTYCFIKSSTPVKVIMLRPPVRRMSRPNRPKQIPIDKKKQPLYPYKPPLPSKLEHAAGLLAMQVSHIRHCNEHEDFHNR